MKTFDKWFPLGIIVLILSLGWSVWLGRTLMTAHD